MKTLKVWNGRGWACENYDDPRWVKACSVHREPPHIYLCAYSLADARRVCAEYCGRLPSITELRDYWSKNCWGTPMNGVKQERGLWIEFEKHKTPTRVV